jgi:hypothetical protein
MRESRNRVISLAAPIDPSEWIRFLSRVLLSFPVMLAGLLLVLAVLTVRSRFDDPDMWWHLKTGEIIWTTHSIPITDVFSYTTNHHAYVAHEWLAQLLIYAAYRFGGYPGLMLWLCFFTASLLLTGYYLCTIYSENAKTGFLGALTIWLFATVGLSIRPQMIGYLLLIVELLLLHLGRTRTPRWFLGLPPLFAIWVNCHGSFFLGITVMGVFLFSSLFNFQKGSLVALPWQPHCRRMLLLALILSIAALFMNPIGVRQIVYPLDTMLLQPVNLSQVDEWQPLQFGDARSLALLGVLGCILLLGILRRTELLWHELLLLALASWAAISHRRMLFAFGILAAPVLSRVLSTAWQGYIAEQNRPALNAALLVASLLTVRWAVPDQQTLAQQVDEKSPTKAVEFMKTHHLSGRMLNEYSYGGYLIWKAPENPVFVDGRADIFEATGVLTEFGNWATLQSDPHTLLDQYGIDFCILARQAPMARVLPLLRSWTAVYADENSVIFERAAAGSASLVDGTRPTHHIPPS